MQVGSRHVRQMYLTSYDTSWWWWKQWWNCVTVNLAFLLNRFKPYKWGEALLGRCCWPVMIHLDDDGNNGEWFSLHRFKPCKLGESLLGRPCWFVSIRPNNKVKELWNCRTVFLHLTSLFKNMQRGQWHAGNMLLTGYERA